MGGFRIRKLIKEKNKEFGVLRNNFNEIVKLIAIIE
jgi:hypothetical protein